MKKTLKELKLARDEAEYQWHREDSKERQWNHGRVHACWNRYYELSKQVEELENGND